MTKIGELAINWQIASDILIVIIKTQRQNFQWGFGDTIHEVNVCTDEQL